MFGRFNFLGVLTLSDSESVPKLITNHQYHDIDVQSVDNFNLYVGGMVLGCKKRLYGWVWVK